MKNFTVFFLLSSIYMHQGLFAESSSKSGFIVSQDGYIITNNHVVDGVEDIKIEVEKEDGSTILQINGVAIHTIEDLVAALQKHSKEKKLAALLENNGHTFFTTITTP